MPRNADGVYAPPASSFNPAVANTIISPTTWNALLVDITAGLNGTPFNLLLNPTSGTALTINTPAGSPNTNIGIAITNAPSGTFGSSQLSPNTVTVNDSVVNALGSLAAFQAQYGATATADEGNGIGLLGVATTLANTNSFYGIGVQGQGFAQHTATGPTGLGGAGQVAGGNFLGHLAAGATGYFSCFGMEINTSVIPTGGNAPKFKAGILIAQNVGDAARGATHDAAMAISSGNATIKWKNGLLFGNMAGQNAFGADSTIIGSTGAQTVSKFIDFSSYTASSMIADFGAAVLQIDGSGNIFLGTADAYAWAGLSRISSPGDGVILLSDHTVGTFSRLQLGGTTTSFPAIKRNGTAINFTLGDGTGNAAITAGGATLNGTTSVVSASFGLSGNISAAAWTTSGIRYANASVTLTDTTSSGTVAAAYSNFFGGNTIAASNATTFTDYFGSFFGTPTAGSNVTLTRKWGFGSDSSVAITSYLAGLALKNESGAMVTNIDSGSTGRYLRFLNTDGTAVFQAGNTNDATLFLDHTTIQFTNLANNVNWGKFDTNGLTIQTGNITMSNASKTLVLKQGANGSVGTFVCNGATPVTVNNTNVAISDAIIISLNTVGGTVGAVPAVKTITASTGFTVAGTASDTSTYNYAIIKNAA